MPIDAPCSLAADGWERIRRAGVSPFQGLAVRGWLGSVGLRTTATDCRRFAAP